MSPRNVALSMGLSPRVRGSLTQQHGPTLSLGSIPACAGKPMRAQGRHRQTWVYPRVCGEAAHGLAIPAYAKGLSPRVRGSREDIVSHLRVAGSIPACAGKPRWLATQKASSGVYPRVCGEAPLPSESLMPGQGLSPRVRGNRRPRGGEAVPAGSIPACAGKPFTVVEPSAHRWVYPRVCGEAFGTVENPMRGLGLSPRVRGSPRATCHNRVERGSIPACAGKPGSVCRENPLGRVYPRVCGEAMATGQNTAVISGLSPRVRGSRKVVFVNVLRIGSIPACAGKPWRRSRRRRTSRVYPRVCGEATVSAGQRNKR